MKERRRHVDMKERRVIRVGVGAGAVVGSDECVL